MDAEYIRVCVWCGWVFAYQGDDARACGDSCRLQWFHYELRKRS